MARKRDANRSVPEWVDKMTDEEIVAHFKDRVGRDFTYERVGREVVDMRKRLLKILIDGLAANGRTGE